MKQTTQSNPYLSGNFAPVRSEDDFAELKITGAIPPELTGTYYRNGPNPQFDPRDANYHWFAGDGMIHAFTVQNGKVSYRNRYVRTPKWVMENDSDKALFGTFGNPMTSDPAVVGKDSGTANTNIIWHANRLLALEEGHQPFELDPVSLAPKGYRDYAGRAGRFTAHPKIDPETGELVFFGYMVGDLPFSNGLAYGVADKAGNVTRLDTFEAPYSSMIHDFFVTKNYVAFPVLPLSGRLQRAMAGPMPFAWEPDKGSHIGVLRRDAGIETIRGFTADPCYVFHPMNMWEEGDTLVIDAMEYATAPLFPNADGSPGKNSSAYLMRWTIDLAANTNAVRRQRIDDMAGGFPPPAARPARPSSPPRPFSPHPPPAGHEVFVSIPPHFYQAEPQNSHPLAARDAPGEPVFVPRSVHAAEGDGFLVTTVYRGRENRSDFVVFDAAAVDRGPIASAAVPRRVPFGFHGNWRPGL